MQPWPHNRSKLGRYDGWRQNFIIHKLLDCNIFSGRRQVMYIRLRVSASRFVCFLHALHRKQADCSYCSCSSSLGNTHLSTFLTMLLLCCMSCQGGGLSVLRSLHGLSTFGSSSNYAGAIILQRDQACLKS